MRSCCFDSDPSALESFLGLHPPIGGNGGGTPAPSTAASQTAGHATILNTVSMLQGDSDLDPNTLVDSLTQSLLDGGHLLQSNLLEQSVSGAQLQAGTAAAPSTSFNLQHAIQQQQQQQQQQAAALVRILVNNFLSRRFGK
jgi:hypothetical protein